MAADVLIYLIVNAIRIGLALFFLSVFLERKLPAWALILAWILTWVVNSIAYLGLNNNWLNLVTNIAGLLCATCLCFNGKAYIKFLVLMLDIATGIAAENIALVLFRAYDPKIQVLTNIFSVFIFMIVVVILDRTLKILKNPGIATASGVMIIIITIGLFFVGYVITYNTSFVTIEFALCVIMLINLSTLYLYNKMSSQYIIQMENDLYKMQSGMYKQQLDIISKSMESNRIMQHDMKHHMLMLHEYASRGETERITDYLNEVTDHIGMRTSEVNTENQLVNSVLNYYFACIRDIGGTVDWDVILHDDMNIDDFDLNALLSNLLSNTYEALKEAENPSAKVSIRYNRGILNIQISNYYTGCVKKEKNGFLTTKVEKAQHGIGLLSVNRIVEKYNGNMETTADNNIFTVRIAIVV